jgi:hypothetical protein
MLNRDQVREVENKGVSRVFDRRRRQAGCCFQQRHGGFGRYLKCDPEEYGITEKVSFAVLREIVEDAPDKEELKRRIRRAHRRADPQKYHD